VCVWCWLRVVAAAVVAGEACGVVVAVVGVAVVGVVVAAVVGWCRRRCWRCWCW